MEKSGNFHYLLVVKAVCGGGGGSTIWEWLVDMCNKIIKHNCRHTWNEFML